MIGKMVEPYLDELVEAYPAMAGQRDNLRRASDLLIKSFTTGNKMLVCGNGGSAADADHIVGELMKSFVLPRETSPELRSALLAQDIELGERIAASLQGALPAISLTQHTALTSAFSNDVDPEMVFAQQVLGYGVRGDVFLGLTTSGNSHNVLYGALTARALGLEVIGMTGASGGSLASYCDVLIAVPETETYKAQELHLPVYHTLCRILERVFFG